MGSFLTAYRLAIILILSLAPFGGAGAMDFRLGCHDGQQVLFAQGKIVQGDAKALRERLRKDPEIQEILFNSPGGVFKEGIRLGRTLRDLDRVARVPDQAVCTSACVWAFMGGVLRFADKGARLGVHMATQINDRRTIGEVRDILATRSKIPIDTRMRRVITTIEKAAAKVVADKAEHLVRMGVSLRLLAPGLNTDPTKVYWLSRKELKSFNLVNAK
jgi:hypothetical protein